MDIAVIGAAGAVGRSVCVQLCAGVLQPGERLQLVGHRGGASETGIFGLCIDLGDAFGAGAPVLEPVLDPSGIAADIVIMVAGETPSAAPDSQITRDDVARTNLPVYREYAEAMAEYGRGHELVIVQSNPVELAVDVFARHLGPHRVIGAGAYNDSQRFQRMVAEAFLASPWGGRTRPLVTGYVLGEHGPGLVPVWSSLRGHGVDAAAWSAFLSHLRSSREDADLIGEATAARAHVADLLTAHHGERAFSFTRGLPPDVRVVVEPWFAHWAGRTSTVTAHSVVDIVAELRSGHRIVLPLQVACATTHWPGVAGVIGLAVDVDCDGWHMSIPLPVTDAERAALLDSAIAVADRLDQWRGPVP